MADKKGGLGRGIGALIPTAANNERPIDVFFSPNPNTTSIPVVPSGAAGSNASVDGLVPVPGATYASIPLAQIVPNRVNPRTVFEPEALAELIHSVREFGVLQPIVVRPIGEKDGKPAFELIMGERRFRASKEAGLLEIPAIVRDTADEDMLRDALLENIHRANLNPLEEASAYQQLLQDFGITQDVLAERIGRSRPHITNTIRLLKLPVEVQKKVAAGVLSAGHARTLLSLPNDARMMHFADRVISEGLSVHSLAEAVAMDNPTSGSGQGKATIKPGGRTDALKEISDRLGDQLDTKVKIALGSKKGQLTIDFATMGDLQRILKLIGYKSE
jgi:ParB family chromosome partitioning protein